MQVSLHEAVGGEWGAFHGLYDPEPLAEGDAVAQTLTHAGIEVGPPLTVPRDGWYCVRVDAEPED